MHYNVPDSFCQAVRGAGIDIVSTANNHCMDEGTKGLQRTLKILDANRILHTGTFAGQEEKRYLVVEKDGLKIAFLSVTYSVNRCYEASSCEELNKYVNLVGHVKKKYSSNSLKRYVETDVIPNLKKMSRKLRGKSTILAYQDTLKENSINHEWLDKIDGQAAEARKEVDLLVVLLHVGGQFNTEPGEFSRFLVDHFCDLGADIIIGHHPHTIQKIEKRQNKVIAWSLGAFSISPSGEYLVHDCLPEYGLVLDVDIEGRRVKDVSYRLVKNEEEENHYLKVCSISDLLESYKGEEKGKLEKEIAILNKRIKY